MTRNTNRRTFLRTATSGLALAGVPSLVLASNNHGEEDVVENYPGESWSERFSVKIDPRPDVVLVTVIDRWKDESYHYVAKVTEESIRPKRVDVDDHQALIQSVENEGGIEPAKIHIPDLPDFVERWDSYSKKISSGCGSVYSAHYMCGVTLETEAPISKYAGPTLGAALGAILGALIGGAPGAVLGEKAGTRAGSVLGTVVGAIVSEGYDTHYLTVAWVDRDAGPSWATIPYLNAQYSGRWNDRRPNQMYTIPDQKPGVHLSPIADGFDV